MGIINLTSGEMREEYGTDLLHRDKSRQTPVLQSPYKIVPKADIMVLYKQQRWMAAVRGCCVPGPLDNS